MRQLIVGNWKMNATLAEAAAIVSPLRDAATDGPVCDLVVCPPATLLNAVAHMLVGSAVEVGGQDCHARPHGAFTGDISAAMLRDAGASWVILGHSERRQGHGESDEMVREKVAAARMAGLRPIVCVGETLAARQSGDAFAVVERQIAGSLPAGFDGAVAYEPIWAIGTGQRAEPADVTAMHARLRALVGEQVRLLYGGSVKAANASVVLSLANVDGALVGGASLDAVDFLGIAHCCGPSRARAAGLEPGAAPGKF